MLDKVAKLVSRFPRVYAVLGKPYVWLLRTRFSGSRDYWKNRYAAGGVSGEGSVGASAEFKASVVNAFVKDNPIADVLEFGCGDGSQLSMLRLPKYVGVDVSPSVLDRCRRRFADDPDKHFVAYDDYRDEKGDLAMSLDVIYHLVEDSVFEPYVARMFGAARKYVVVYSTDTDRQGEVQAPHVRHRKLTNYIAAHHPDWRLVSTVRNPVAPEAGVEWSVDFFIFAKRDVPEPRMP